MNSIDDIRRAEFAIGFVTFNPTPAFYERLSWSATSGHQIYVFDNSPEVAETKKWCDSFGGIKFITAGNNVGLGIGLSIINATAYSDGFSMLLFFDQDTNFDTTTLEFIGRAAAVHIPSRDLKIGALVFDAKKNSTTVPNYTAEAVLLAISSGSLFNLHALRQIGWHNPSYFVDGVDYELCLRARSNGYAVLKCSHTPGFDHETEQPDQAFIFWGKRVPLRRYSVSRIKDSVGAYFRLLVFTSRKFDLLATQVLLRSFMIFLFGQVLARTVLRKNA